MNILILHKHIYRYIYISPGTALKKPTRTLEAAWQLLAFGCLPNIIIHLSLYIYIYIYVYTHNAVHVCMYVCMYVCM